MTDLQQMEAMLERRGFVESQVDDYNDLGTKEFMKSIIYTQVVLSFGTGDKGDVGAYCQFRFNLETGELNDIASYYE